MSVASLTDLAANVDYLADALEVFLPGTSVELRKRAGRQQPPQLNLWGHVAMIAAWRVERILNSKFQTFDDSNLRNDFGDRFASLEVGATLWHLRLLIDDLYLRLNWEFLCVHKRYPEWLDFRRTKPPANLSAPEGMSDRLRTIARLLRVPSVIGDVLLHSGNGNAESESARLGLGRVEKSEALLWKNWATIFDRDQRVLQRDLREAGALIESKANTRRGVVINLANPIVKAENRRKYDTFVQQKGAGPLRKGRQRKTK